MHTTLVPLFLGYVDSIQCRFEPIPEKKAGKLHIDTVGWAFAQLITDIKEDKDKDKDDYSFGIEYKFRNIAWGHFPGYSAVPRADVTACYEAKNKKLAVPASCGWDIHLVTDVPFSDYIEDEPDGGVELCINVINNRDGQTFMIFKQVIKNVFSKPKPTFSPGAVLVPAICANSLPSYVVIDNIYVNPDQVRDFALAQRFAEHKQQHKGQRTEAVFRFPGLKQRFEAALGRSINNWEKYGTNGCFQFCTAEDALVYHTDQQEWAGVLFLTPNAPVDCGTTIYRPRNQSLNANLVVSPELHSQVFARGFYDSTPFEVVDVVGNVYNRLLLFNSKMIHAASKYFGTNANNGRLFQMFFFDIATKSQG
jgi:hypothetical protein